MNQPSGLGGVPAAPNRCEIKAKVLAKRQHADFPDKWLYEVQILDSRDKEGPNFAQPGQAAEAFSFESPELMDVGCSIAAEAEYIGGPTQGQFQLTQVKRV